jgi:hypothetical protein
MDELIYSKLPSGGSLWNYKNDYSNKYIQKTYDNPNIENAIFKNAVKKPVTEQGNDKDSRKNRKQTLLNFIIHTIDPLASLYTRQMFEQAEAIFKDRLTQIVSTGSIHQWLGPKKSRTLLAWITKNNHGVADEMGKIITDFLTWFLDKSMKYIPEHAHYVADSNEEGIIYVTYDHKTYVIKN